MSELKKKYVDYFQNGLIPDLERDAGFPIRPKHRNGNNYIAVGSVSGHRGKKAWYSSGFSEMGYRDELILESDSKEKNKQVYDLLHGQSEAIEAEVGFPVTWERLDDSIRSRIAVYTHIGIDEGPERLEQLRERSVSALNALHRALNDRADAALTQVGF